MLLSPSAQITSPWPVLAVAEPSSQVRRTLTTAGLAKILPVYDAEAGAFTPSAIVRHITQPRSS